MKILGEVVVVAVTLLVAVLLFSLPVMWLWNWLLVDLFQFPVIDFWQAVGILLLCRALFANNGSSSTK